MTYNVPGLGEVELTTIILDLDGTLTVGGIVPEGVKERLDHLKQMGFRIVLLSDNTRGNAEQIAASLDIAWKETKTAEDKASAAKELGPETCVAIGNGLIDIELMKIVELRIATLQAEGVHMDTLTNSDAIMPSITDALDLLIDPMRLTATFRQ